VRKNKKVWGVPLPPSTVHPLHNTVMYVRVPAARNSSPVRRRRRRRRRRSSD